MAETSARDRLSQRGFFPGRAGLLAAAALLGAVLSACDRPPTSLPFDRAAYRDEAIATCSDGMRLGGAARDVGDRVCGCGVDRFIAGKPDRELESMDEEVGRVAMRAAVQYCLSHEPDLGPLPAGLPVPAAPSPTADALPGAGSAGVDAAGADPADLDGGEVAVNEVRPQDANESAASRWRAPPPR